jgi:hypothetical protein
MICDEASVAHVVGVVHICMFALPQYTAHHGCTIVSDLSCYYVCYVQPPVQFCCGGER